MITVVLVEPANPGNVGAIARIMKNFGFRDMLLINPKCDFLCQEARNRAKNAQDVLKKARTGKFDVLKRYDYRIGTTSKLGNDYNLPRTPLTPREASAKISIKSKVAMVFGRESYGLSNDELDRMDFIINIPASKYSALNLSHAVAIILYELYLAQNPDKKEKKFKPISRKEIDVLLDMINELLDKQRYATKQKKQTQKILWKHIITKSMLTKREAFALMGFLRKL